MTTQQPALVDHIGRYAALHEQVLQVEQPNKYGTLSIRFEELKVYNLKLACRELGMIMSGKKTEIVERLLDRNKGVLPATALPDGYSYWQDHSPFSKMFAPPTQQPDLLELETTESDFDILRTEKEVLQVEQPNKYGISSIRFEELKVNNLKLACRELGVIVYGNKAEIVEWLLGRNKGVLPATALRPDGYNRSQDLSEMYHQLIFSDLLEVKRDQPSESGQCKPWRRHSGRKTAPLFTSRRKEYLDSIERHIQASGFIDRHLAHLVFVGLPGSGKTTLIYRLLGLKEAEEMCKACASTGVVSGIITVEVTVAEDEASLHPITVGQGCKWEKADYRRSCWLQMDEDSFVLETDSGECDARSRPVAAASSSVVSSGSSIRGVSIAKIDMDEIRQMMLKEGFSAVQESFKDKRSLYISDTGGQVEFQELLPLLIAGRAVFVFVFPLHIDMNQHMTVSYRMKVGDEVKHSNVYTSSLTIKESFLQTLASVDSMEAFGDPSIAKHNPYVFAVGTHKDCLISGLGNDNAERKIAEINNNIKVLVEEHKYEDLVVYADKAENQVLFAVDNTNESSIFQEIRSRIMELIHRDEFRIRFPVNYLLASLKLEESTVPFIKREDFTRDVAQFGIEESDIDHLLQFLHSRIGQIRYFADVEELKGLIVREPQSLYNLVSCLIVQSFLSQSVTMAQHSEIQKGIYSFSSLYTKELCSHSEHITPKELISLLKQLRIIAPFYDSKAKVEKYFIPCVLNHLNESPHEEKSSTVQSLVMSFDQGHCPKGLFGVLLHTILTNKEKRLDWNLDISKIFKDQVSFKVGPYRDVVTIKFCTTHIEVALNPVFLPQRSGPSTLKEICVIVRSTVQSGIEQATRDLHYNKVKTRHSLGVMCSKCGTSHEVMVVDDRQTVVCSKEYCPLPESGCFWFGATPTYSFPALKVNRVFCVKEGSCQQLEFVVDSDLQLEESPVNGERHTLSRLGGKIRIRNVYIQGNAIVFEKVNRRDAGTYFISSFNVEGEGKTEFQLRVKFAPEYNLSSEYLEVPEGTSPSVPFTVSSEPPLADDVKHTLTTSEGGRVTKRFRVKNYSITFRNVTPKDSGLYIISCCNDDGEVGRGEIELEVTANLGNSAASFTAPIDSQTEAVVRQEDVNVVLDHLLKYAYKWDAIGTALNFQLAELENIRCDPQLTTLQQRLQVLLTQWSHGPTATHPDTPTVERLCSALRSDLVGLGDVANQLEEMKGSLPRKLPLASCSQDDTDL